MSHQKVRVTLDYDLMATTERPSPVSAPVPAVAPVLPGVLRALIVSGKLQHAKAEEVYKKALATRTSLVAELTGSGAVSSADLAHVVSAAFGAPLLNLSALDVQRLPKDLLDAKFSKDHKVLALTKKGAFGGGHRRPFRSTSRRQNQIHHSNWRGLDHCRIRQTHQIAGCTV